MIIDYEKYPALEILTREKPRSVQNMAEEDKEHFQFDHISNAFWDIVYRTGKVFNKRISVVSKSFAEAMTKSAKQLRSLYFDVINDPEETLDLNETIIGNGNITAFLKFVKHRDVVGKDAIDLNFVAFLNVGVPIVVVTDDVYWVSGWLKNKYDEDGVHEQVAKLVSEAMFVALFKKYAEVETKTVFPKQKYKNPNDKTDKFLNNTQFVVDRLNSNWFTNISREEGFTVSGHFRLQPYKDGRKKFIWINDFEKSGYHRKAVVETQK